MVGFFRSCPIGRFIGSHIAADALDEDQRLGMEPEWQAGAITLSHLRRSRRGLAWARGDTGPLRANGHIMTSIVHSVPVPRRPPALAKEP